MVFKSNGAGIFPRKFANPYFESKYVIDGDKHPLWLLPITVSIFGWRFDGVK